jgi:hypothetical protein
MGHHRHDAGHVALKATIGGIGLLAMSYAAYAAGTWYRYGRIPARTKGRGSQGSLLERFMPAYEVDERHEIQVHAPVEYTFAAARAMDVNRSPLARAIFAVRTLPSRLRGEPARQSSTPLLDETLAIGWRILAETPDREVVVGAVTQPWRAEVKFRGLDPDAFARFTEPGYARIAWTLEAIPLGPTTSLFRSRTRVSTTDPRSRTLFRRYWAVVSPGVRLIRLEALRLVRADAERRFRAATPAMSRAEPAG